MALYGASFKKKLGTSTDEVGTLVGMYRFEDESLADFRARVLLEARAPTTIRKQSSLISPGRYAGVLDTFCGQVLPSIPNPESISLEVYKNKLILKDTGVEVESIDLTDVYNGLILADVKARLEATSLVTVVIEAGFENKRSALLRPEGTRRFVKVEELNLKKANALSHTYIEDFLCFDRGLCVTEVVSPEDIVYDGEYYMDYLNGVLFTYREPTSYISYHYQKWPFDLYLQDIRMVELMDETIESQLYGTIVDDETFEDKTIVLSTYGTKVYNELYNLYPLGWGK